MEAIREIVIARFGGAKTLGVTEAQRNLRPGPGEVSVRVTHSGINFADIQMRLGFYPDAPKRPFVPGYEVSGVIHEVGEGVTRFQPGDSVVAGTFFGGYTSKITLPEHQVLPLPEGMSLEAGAALPVNFFTSHLALFEMGRVREGDRVLIECATGGVGTLAVQMAKRAGAHVVGLTTSPHKLSYIEGLGAQAMTREAFEADATVKDFDFILNASGGAFVKRQKARLDLTGRMVCIGLSSGVKDGRRNFFRLGLAALRTPRVGLISLMNDNAGIFGLNALHVLDNERWVRRLVRAFEDGELHALAPHVDRVFPAEEVADAHRLLETRQAKGKVLLAW